MAALPLLNISPLIGRLEFQRPFIGRINPRSQRAHGPDIAKHDAAPVSDDATLGIAVLRS
jgi:hypothetical protein